MKLFVKDKGFYKSFFTMALTISLQNIIVYAVNLADNVMIGGYSELSLSAVAVVNQIQFMLQMIALGTSNGLTVLTSQYWGVKKMQPIRRVFAVALAVGFALSLAVFVAVFFAPAQVLSLLTDQTAVVAEAERYAKIVCFSYVPFVVSQLLLALMRSVEKVRIGFGVSLVALVTNVTLNYALIYGKFGAPAMGIKGAAIATLISRLVELMVVAVYVFAAGISDNAHNLKHSARNTVGAEHGFGAEVTENRTLHSHSYAPASCRKHKRKTNLDIILKIAFFDLEQIGNFKFYVLFGGKNVYRNYHKLNKP